MPTGVTATSISRLRSSSVPTSPLSSDPTRLRRGRASGDEEWTWEGSLRAGAAREADRELIPAAGKRSGQRELQRRPPRLQGDDSAQARRPGIGGRRRHVVARREGPRLIEPELISAAQLLRRPLNVRDPVPPAAPAATARCFTASGARFAFAVCARLLFKSGSFVRQRSRRPRSTRRPELIRARDALSEGVIGGDADRSWS